MKTYEDNTKQCSTCKQRSTVDAFHRNCTQPDGRANVCKRCATEYAVKWSRKNRNKARAAFKAFYKKHRNKYRTRAKTNYWKDREKHLARNMARQKLREGAIQRSVCVVCGSVHAEMHHPDYSLPLHVIWLCKEHHAQVHRGKLTIK